MLVTPALSGNSSICPEPVDRHDVQQRRIDQILAQEGKTTLHRLGDGDQ